MRRESPETETLRTLVAAVQAGRKPDLSAALRLLNSDNSPSDDDIRCAKDDVVSHVSSLIVRARSAILSEPENKKLDRAYQDLWRRIYREETAVARRFSRSFNALVKKAKSGKLTKTQFDKAIKDLCK